MDKEKALEVALNQMERHMEKVLLKLEKWVQNIESSGSLGIDIALGVGGYPKGRVIEIFGPESSGKPRLHAIADVKKMVHVHL